MYYSSVSAYTAKSRKKNSLCLVSATTNLSEDANRLCVQFPLPLLSVFRLIQTRSQGHFPVDTSVVAGVNSCRPMMSSETRLSRKWRAGLPTRTIGLVDKSDRVICFKWRQRRASTQLWLVSLAILPSCRAFVVNTPTIQGGGFHYQAAYPYQVHDRRVRHPSEASRATSTQLPCQLFGMNCATATSFGLSWPDFCKRGGETDIHADGWGLAYYEGQGGVRQFHDVEAASTSPLASFLGQQRIETRNMLAHIRYATSGKVDLCNVHPFQREYVC